MSQAGRVSLELFDRLYGKEKQAIHEVAQEGITEIPSADSIAVLTSVEENFILQPRASSIYDCCLRQHVLCTLSKKKKKRHLSFNQLLTFAIGNALHSYIQNKEDIYGGRRHGLWKCLACDKILPFGPPPTEKCSCGANPTAFWYQEVYFNFPSISGHPDLFLQELQTSLLTLVELKTIKGDDFDGLAAPLVSHVYQVIAYLMMLRKLTKHFPKPVNTNHVEVHYFSKGHKQKTFPVKTFIVRYDEEIAQSIKEKLSFYRKCVTSKGEILPPPHQECLRYGGKSSRLNECPVSTRCFSNGETK